MRDILITAALALCLVFAVPAYGLTQEPEAEDFRVYQALIANAIEPGTEDSFVVSSETEVRRGALGEVVEYVLSKSPMIENATLEDFKTKNLAAHTFEKAPQEITPPMAFVSPGDVKSIDTKGWKHFYETHPGAKAVFTISRIGFNSEKTEALLYAALRNGPAKEGGGESGAGHYYIMKKSDEGWSVLKKFLLWEM